MTDERWEEFVESAMKNFDDVTLTKENLEVETDQGIEVRGTEDVLEFQNEAGRFRLVRENRPVVLEKKEFYSHRAGDTARTEYKFSETEFSHKLRVYRENRYGDWEEISADRLGL